MVGDYRTINGVRCIEISPIPVTQDTVFPCAVRLVQDNSLMGKMNKRMILNTLMNTNGEFIALGLSHNYGMEIQTSWGAALPYEHFEVIGIPKPLLEKHKGDVK